MVGCAKQWVSLLLTSQLNKLRVTVDWFDVVMKTTTWNRNFGSHKGWREFPKWDQKSSKLINFIFPSNNIQCGAFHIHTNKCITLCFVAALVCFSYTFVMHFNWALSYANGPFIRFTPLALLYCALYFTVYIFRLLFSQVASTRLNARSSSLRETRPSL